MIKLGALVGTGGMATLGVLYVFSEIQGTGDGGIFILLIGAFVLFGGAGLLLKNL